MNDIVPKAILDHILKGNPEKALVISCNGWKSYVAKAIAKLLYYKGIKSKFVHKTISTFIIPRTLK